MPRAENPSVSVPSDVAVPAPETLCFLRAPLGLSVIAACRRLSGGASQESWLIDAAGLDGSPRRFVLRRTPAATWTFDLAAGIETEAALMRLAGAASVPSPAVAAVLDGTEGLGRGFVMGFVAGETLGHKIVRDPAFAAVRPQLAGQCGRVLAAIHGIDAGDVPGLRLQTAEAQVAALAELHAGGGWVRPVFDLALAWLKAHLPAAPLAPRLVHGDFRNGNLIVGPDGIRAVLDWELAHLGDPLEDLGWLCVPSWRFGAEAPVGGFGTREELFAAYEAASGAPVDAAAVCFWEVLGTLRWGLICAESANRFLTGGDHSVERAVIARRASETEIDLLDLLTTEGM